MSDVHPRQAEAVARAELDGDGHVQVYGPKEGGALERGEAECTGPKASTAEVIYHPRAVHLTGGGWTCADCGETSAPTRRGPLH